MLLAALPLADEAGRDVEVAGEHGLARAFAFPQRADFFGGERVDGCQTGIVELAHGLLVHDAGRVQAFCRFMDRGHYRTAILLSHCTSPPSGCRWLSTSPGPHRRKPSSPPQAA